MKSCDYVCTQINVQLINVQPNGGSSDMMSYQPFRLLRPLGVKTSSVSCQKISLFLSNSFLFSSVIISVFRNCSIKVISKSLSTLWFGFSIKCDVSSQDLSLFSLYMMPVVIETYVHLGLGFSTILKVASCAFCQVYYPFALAVETVQDFESFAI